MNVSNTVHSTVTKLVSLPHLSPTQDPVQEFLPSQEFHTVNTPTISNKTTNTIVTLDNVVNTHPYTITYHSSLTQPNEEISFVSSKDSDETYNDNDLSYDSSIVSMPPLLQRTANHSDSSSDGHDDSSDDSSSYYFEDNKDNIAEWFDADDDKTINNAHLSLSLKADDKSIVSKSSSTNYTNDKNDITTNNDVTITKSSTTTTTSNLVSLLSTTNTNVDTYPVPTSHNSPVVILSPPTMNTFERNKTVHDNDESKCDSKTCT